MDPVIIREFVVDGKVVSRVREDGYMNATMICKAAYKEFAHYCMLKRTSIFLKLLSERLGLDRSQLTIIKKGGNERGGSWVHPYVALDVAAWCSPSFQVHIYEWVREWSKQLGREEMVQQVMNDCLVQDAERFNNDGEEAAIRDRLAQELRDQGDLSVRVEVPCEHGIIDILSSSAVIEVKVWHNWKHAIGQVIAYAECHSDKRKCIYLFEHADDADSRMRPADRASISRVCAGAGIDVCFA